MREEVLALSRKVLGDEHPETLLAMSNQAKTYRDAGRLGEALEMGVIDLVATDVADLFADRG